MSRDRYAKARAFALTGAEFEHAITRDALLGFIIFLVIAIALVLA